MNDQNHERELHHVLTLATQFCQAVDGLGNDISGAVDEIRRRQRHGRLAVILMAGALVACIILTVVMAFTVAKVNDNAEQIKDVQETTGTSVLCPLYESYLRFEGNPAPPGTDQETYDNSFKVIREGYKVLGCENQ